MITGLIAAGSYRLREKREKRDECAPAAMLVFAGCAMLFLLLFFYYTEKTDYTIR
jgi:multisubunit Na+/H+ antiporter MnhB subunit